MSTVFEKIRSSVAGKGLTFLAYTDFFPPRPITLNGLKSICIGTKSRALGDALIVTPLARRLKERFPELKVYTYGRAFNSVVFENNPYIDGVLFAPASVYGDDANYGHGHNIQLKENFFGLEKSSDPKPEIYFSRSEISSSQKTKPLAMVHPSGVTNCEVVDLLLWKKIVELLSEKYFVSQIGLKGHPKVDGCDEYFFLEKTFSSARHLFQKMREADLFFGVDSGPMHVARAWDVRSLIFLNRDSPEKVFSDRKEFPYFRTQNYLNVNLYEKNFHIGVIRKNSSQILEGCRRFLSESNS